ncbi:Uncharacterised protein [Mycobacteroides abscessus subsp. abscessus]|nr:Uncharacterised protein [Mycobacteroides abscessus subsp. abscessus]
MGASETVDSQNTAGTARSRTKSIAEVICCGVACCSALTGQMYFSVSPASLAR